MDGQTEAPSAAAPAEKSAVEKLAEMIANGHLTIKGERYAIELNANSGGIWLFDQTTGGNKNDICIYLNNGHGPYIGIYGPKNVGQEACDIAIGVDRDSQPFIQLRRPDGKMVHAQLSTIVEHVQSIMPAGPPHPSPTTNPSAPA